MKWCLAIFVVVLGLLAIGFVPECTTHYASSSVKRNFSSVQLGTTLDGLYQQLGKPFYAVVIHNGTNAPVFYDYDVKVEHLRKQMQDADITLWLQYSRNNGVSRWYNRYEVEMRNDKVVSVNRDFQD